MTLADKSSASSTVILLCFIQLILFSWLSSGTLNPYAALNPEPLVTQRCHYLKNTDDPHFQAPFLMLEGKDRTSWEGSVVLRRILYPVLAYPFVETLGATAGGFLVNLILISAAFFLLTSALKRSYGIYSAVCGALLLASYPGISYWVGLPYSYATIVPFTICCFLLLDSIRQDSPFSKIAAVCIAIGMLSLGYDLLPFFGLAMVIMLCLQRRFFLLPVAAGLLVAPQVVSNWLLWKLYGVSLINSNTQSVRTIFASFLASPDYHAWGVLLMKVPLIFLHNFIFSNFAVLPLLFAALFLLARGLPKTERALTTAEKSLLMSVAAVFLLNNCAPPYTGWQLRGFWIARLYQPVFVVYIMYASRLGPLFSGMRGKVFTVVMAAAVAGQSLVVLGPWAAPGYSALLYHNFYQQSSPQTYVRNLLRFGRRPLGICSTTLPSAPDLNSSFPAAGGS